MKILDFIRRKPKEKTWTPTDEGWLNKGWDWGWWQQDLQPLQGGTNEAVEACVSALSQTVAMCPIHHLQQEENGEDKRRYGSKPERVLLNPNDYESRTFFFNNLIRSVYFHGNGYAVATRDGNRAIENLFLIDPRNCHGVIDPESGEVFYWVSSGSSNQFNPDTDLVYPSRDVLHVRINATSKEPLKGISPIAAAAKSIAANSNIVGHQSAFFANMARPSGVMTTPEKITPEQANQIREALDKQAQGFNSGKVPVLGGGLKWESMSLTSQDAQLVEAFAMTNESISRVFRVPLPMINSLSDATYNNAESMMRWFLASGLGFLLEHIELELNRLFSLPFNERLNFDTKTLLRSDWKSQVETLGEGILKGLYSPNEARNMMGLPSVEDGDEPRVQQQVVPLSAWDQEAPTPEPQPADDVTASLVKGFKSYAR